MIMRIVKAGILDTIQDAGRYGFARWGINENGAMDQVARVLANALVGNPQHAATLEMHYPAPEIVFDSTRVISITGGDFCAEVDGFLIPLWRTVVVPKGARLLFKRKLKGARTYLAVNGGFDLAPWLDSVSTNLKANAGGVQGRKLITNDEVALRMPSLNPPTPSSPRILSWSINVNKLYDTDLCLPVLAGREWSALADDTKEQMLKQEYVINSSSDRMATNLDHPPIHTTKLELFSSAVTRGTMQLLPSGKLIILMADHQTTGGYPRIAHVISAHHHILSQVSAGDAIRFRMVSRQDAENLLISIQKEIGMITRSIKEKLNSHNVWR